MSAIDDAAILYLAINGWGDPIRCASLPTDGSRLERCNSRHVVGISQDDGCPLCDKCIDHPDEIGHRFAPGVLAAIKARRRKHYKEIGEKLEE
jgi:hypothetical protein